MVADHGRAEDITQDVFISALRRMRDSERPIAFKPWIYEIAKNACIDDFRRARRAREVPITGDDELEHENPRLIARAVTPEAAIESRQQLTDLRGAFRGLSESHHKIIVLRELEGLSYSQIGERMGMSRPVVESTLFRARRRLSEEYEELVSGRRCEHVQAVIGERGGRTVRSLGIKERRLLARHLAHCQPCRRHAHLTGFDESGLQVPGVVGKIAAVLPIPAFLRLRQNAADAGAGASRAVASRAHAFNALQSAQSLASTVDPAGPFAGVGRVAAGAAALVIAGAGGGIVAGVTSGSGSHHSTSRTGASTAASSGTVHSRSGAGAASHAGVAAGASATGTSTGRPALGRSVPASSTSGASLRAGSVAPRSSERLPSIRRPAGHAYSGRSGASTANASPGSNGAGLPVNPGGTVKSAGNGLSGTASGVTSGMNGVASGVDSGVGGVASGVNSSVGGVATGVNKLLPNGVGSSTSGSTGSIPLPGIQTPVKKTGSPNRVSQTSAGGTTTSIPNPTSVVAPLMNKLGLG
jgi:RNA polymerase sigma factor (sigma-70 family)